MVTDGSRATVATGWAAFEAARDAVVQIAALAAALWEKAVCAS